MNLSQNLNKQYQKSDIIFYRAYCTIWTEVRCSQVYFLFKIVLFSVAIPVCLYAFDTPFNQVIYAMIINGSLSAVALIPICMVSWGFFGNVEEFMKISQQTQHRVEENISGNNLQIHDCVSDRILIAFSGAQQEDVSIDLKNVYAAITINQIRSYLTQQKLYYKIYRYTYPYLQLASEIYTIYVLATFSMNTFQQFILILYAVIQAIVAIPTIFEIIVLALAPIILCCYCCMACCRREAEQSMGVLDLQQKQATMEDILNAEQDCTICYQKFQLNQKIYVMKCSEKHVFHANCLNQWVKVKKICPLCRADLPFVHDGVPNQKQVIERSDVNQ